MFNIVNESWVVPTLIIIALVIIIGNLSTFQKSSKTPLRKKGLNDLKETLPRSNKPVHKVASFPTKQHIHKTKNSD